MADSHKTYYGIFLGAVSRRVQIAQSNWVKHETSGNRSRPRKGQLVISRLYCRRQLRAQGRIVHVGMKIGQNCTPGLDPRDPFQCLVEIEMARVWALAQRVDDPDLESRKRRDAVGRQTLDISRIGHIAKAEAQGRDIAVILQNRQRLDWATLSVNGDRVARDQALFSGDGRIFAAGRRHEAIAEAGMHGTRGGFVEIDIDAAALVDEQRP